MNIINLKTTTIPDLWFQAIYSILDNGRRFTIDRGSYAGQTRLEFDMFNGLITHPAADFGTPNCLPQMPAGCEIPAPVEFGYVFGGEGYERSYVEYLMTESRQPGEQYTYGQRLIAARQSDISQNRLNQIQHAISIYKKYGHRNNQMVLQVAEPFDMILSDPPCLRHIDTRIQDGKLHFYVYFRSWDLWGGLPANLVGIVALQIHMAGEIGVEVGEMYVSSKGLHLYGYAERLAELRCMREEKNNRR